MLFIIIFSLSALYSLSLHGDHRSRGRTYVNVFSACRQTVVRSGAFCISDKHLQLPGQYVTRPLVQTGKACATGSTPEHRDTFWSFAQNFVPNKILLVLIYFLGSGDQQIPGARPHRCPHFSKAESEHIKTIDGRQAWRLGMIRSSHLNRKCQS